MNPLEYVTKEVDRYFMSFEKMYPKAYNKKTTKVVIFVVSIILVQYIN